MDVRKYMASERSVHYPYGNKWVAVVWNCKTKIHTLTRDGVSCQAFIPEPTGQPYIDFVWVNAENENDVWIDEDSTVAGGIDINYAKEIRKELANAIKYLEDVS